MAVVVKDEEHRRRVAKAIKYLEAAGLVVDSGERAEDGSIIWTLADRAKEDPSYAVQVARAFSDFEEMDDPEVVH